MDIIENIKLALKFEKCYETSKRFYGDEYPKIIILFTDIIKNHQIIKEIDNPIKATIELSNLTAFKENGMNLMLLMAACYELSTS